MFIFILIYLVSFAVAVKELISGNRQGFFLFIVFGLSIYTTAMSVAFLIGLRDFIPFFQSFKELLVISTLGVNIAMLKTKPKLHLIDYLILAFLIYTSLYAILPIGEQSLSVKILAFKSASFFTLVYFTGRLFDIKSLYLSKYFNYIMLVTIAAGVIVLYEFGTNEFLQSKTGYADYVYYFYNVEPSGSFGLSTTFESEGGYKRFASIFANPLEHAAATLIALAIMMALYTNEDDRIDFKPLGLIAFAASLCSITFAFSRAPFASYFLMIYVYAYLIRLKFVYKTINYSIIAVACYIIYLITQLENKVDGVMAVVLSTIDFSNPSSVGHVIEWIQGVAAIIEHPFGLGLGASGRVGGSMGGQNTVGGENQYIIIGVQAGIVALALYTAIYIAFIRQGLKWRNKLKGKERMICIAVLMLKIGFLIPSFTSEFESSSYISYINWFLSGLFIAVIAQHKPDDVQLIAAA